jgi:tRNA(Ile2) C34 agmatinyltransferase TiaS
MINLGALAQQILTANENIKLTYRTPVCPRCKENPRARTEMGGALKDYCKECNRVIANQRNAKYRKPKEAVYG